MPKSDLDPKSSPKSDPLEFAHLPSGELNVPYLLANANLLFQEGDLAAAASLFRAVKSHPKYGFCGGLRARPMLPRRGKISDGSCGV
jgi:hypothetical protein